MIWVLTYITFILAGVIWLIESGRSAGEDKVKRETLEDFADDIHTAKQARDRYDADPVYRKRMQERFKRK